MRKELGIEYGIRTNMVIPDVVNTGWADKVNDLEGRKATQELNKIAIEPDDVENAIFFL